MIWTIFLICVTFQLTYAVPAECFASGSYDVTESEADVSNFERLKNDEFDAAMKLSEISGCVNRVGYLKNIQLHLKHESSQTLSLSQVGPYINGQTCDSMQLADDEFV